jgi:hypothetical protein
MDRDQWGYRHSESVVQCSEMIGLLREGYTEPIESGWEAARQARFTWNGASLTYSHLSQLKKKKLNFWHKRKLKVSMYPPTRTLAALAHPSALGHPAAGGGPPRPRPSAADSSSPCTHPASPSLREPRSQYGSARSVWLSLPSVCRAGLSSPLPARMSSLPHPCPPTPQDPRLSVRLSMSPPPASSRPSPSPPAAVSVRVLSPRSRASKEQGREEE